MQTPNLHQLFECYNEVLVSEASDSHCERIDDVKLADGSDVSIDVFYRAIWRQAHQERHQDKLVTVQPAGYEIKIQEYKNCETNQSIPENLISPESYQQIEQHLIDIWTDRQPGDTESPDI